MKVWSTGVCGARGCVEHGGVWSTGVCGARGGVEHGGVEHGGCGVVRGMWSTGGVYLCINVNTYIRLHDEQKVNGLRKIAWNYTNIYAALLTENGSPGDFP
jgi:hypothetical protein